jgi:hypothetical protein
MILDFSFVPLHFSFEYSKLSIQFSLKKIAVAVGKILSQGHVSKYAGHCDVNFYDVFKFEMTSYSLMMHV